MKKEKISLEFEYKDFENIKKQIDLNLYDIVYGDKNISIVHNPSFQPNIFELKIIKKNKNYIINEKSIWDDLEEYCEKEEEDNNNKKENNSNNKNILKNFEIGKNSFIEIKQDEIQTLEITQEMLKTENEKYLELLNKNINEIAEKETELKKIIESKETYELYKKDMLIQLTDIKNNIEEKALIRDKINNEIENNKEKALIVLEIEKKKKEFNLIIEEIKKNNSFLEKQRKLINIMEDKLKTQNEMRDYKIEFEKKIKVLLNNIINKFFEQLKIKNEEKINLYLNELKELEKQRNEKYEEMMGINEKNKLELIKIGKLNNVKHINKKCKKCGEDPIEGILYKCSECTEYYLCEKCEQINYCDKSHIHNFIKIRKPSIKYNIEQKLLENNKNNIIELNDDNKLNNFNNEDYSYECKIEQYILNKDEENKIIKLLIKNNGINQWIKNNTFLKIQLNEDFFCDDIELDSLKPYDSQEVNLLLKEKKDIKKINYTLLFNFFVQNKIYGNPLSIDIKFNA